MTDEEAVKVVADALMKDAIGDWTTGEQAQPAENFPFVQSLCEEQASIAVAALRKAGWGPGISRDEFDRFQKEVDTNMAKVADLIGERDEARSLLRDLEEAAKFVLDANPHMNYSGNLRQALAAVAQARKDGGFERLPR